MFPLHPYYSHSQTWFPRPRPHGSWFLGTIPDRPRVGLTPHHVLFSLPLGISQNSSPPCTSGIVPSHRPPLHPSYGTVGKCGSESGLGVPPSVPTRRERSNKHPRFPVVSYTHGTGRRVPDHRKGSGVRVTSVVSTLYSCSVDASHRRLMDRSVSSDAPKDE